MKRYQVRVDHPRALGYRYVVLDTTTHKIAMYANSRRSALKYAKQLTARAAATK